MNDSIYGLAEVMKVYLPDGSVEFRQTSVRQHEIQSRKQYDKPVVLDDNELIEILSNITFENEDISYSGKGTQRPELVDTQTGKKHPRNIMVSKNALILAKHQCEYDNSHGSFKRKAPPHFMYTEPHHLIPLTLDAYNDFENSLDVEENICSLCSTCHKCLHYGSIDERDRILEKLLEERQPFLCAVGLEITLDSLRKYY